jgi:hypothetical protein
MISSWHKKIIWYAFSNLFILVDIIILAINNSKDIGIIVVVYCHTLIVIICTFEIYLRRENLFFLIAAISFGRLSKLHCKKFNLVICSYKFLLKLFNLKLLIIYYF